MQSEKNQLKSAFILLRCDKKEHNDCRKIRDALLEKHPNVRSAYTTKAEINGERWCVAATALVNTAKEKQFEKELFALETKTARPIGVSGLHLVVDNCNV